MSARPPTDRHGGRRSLLLELLRDSETEELEAVLSRAELLLGPGGLPPLAALDGFDQAARAMRHGWAAVHHGLVSGGRAAAVVLGADSLFDLLSRFGRAELMVRSAQVRHRDQSVRLAGRVLAGLQEITSVLELVEVGAQAVCELGFDRAIVSSVRSSMWVTEALVVEGDAAWASEILEVGRASPLLVTSGVPEQDLVRRRRPIVVTRASGRSSGRRVHQALGEVSRSRSYVAAPIVSRSGVSGFLHADRFFHRGDVTTFDSELLGLFAEGYGFALERAVILGELHEIRARVHRLSQGIDRVLESRDLRPGAGAGFTARNSVDGEVDPVAGVGRERSDRLDHRLTRREHEVLQLMSCGDTNARIAGRLTITEGTVKSHVKNILRKLGASNRAEAVARWHASALPEGLGGES